MRHSIDPRQGVLFDPYDGLFSPLARKRIEDGWPTLFGAVVLELMPVKPLGQHFHAVLGRPSKELYAMAGLLFLQETFDWTNADAVDAYLFRSDVQFALNLQPGVDELCERTLERYRKHFLDDDLAAQTMHAVTGRLVELLELDISRQRLDSTHVFSTMATFGRTRLLGVTVQRFLTQVKRHAPEAYAALPEALRSRYAVSVGKLFAAKKASAESKAKTLQQVAEDVRDLIERFASDTALSKRPSYQALVRVFAEHCEIVAEKVQVRAKSTGASLQNPSDPDATYDGHKGQGYKLQLAETCGDGDVQLLVGALVQTAAEHDANALKPMLEQLDKQGRLPESLLGDTLVWLRRECPTGGRDGGRIDQPGRRLEGRRARVGVGPNAGVGAAVDRRFRARRADGTSVGVPVGEDSADSGSRCQRRDDDDRNEARGLPKLSVLQGVSNGKEG